MSEQVRLPDSRQSDDARRSAASSAKDHVPFEESKKGNGAYTVSLQQLASTLR